MHCVYFTPQINYKYFVTDMLSGTLYTMGAELGRQLDNIAAGCDEEMIDCELIQFLSEKGMLEHEYK
jgi:DNA-directed RNA polymerase specialized sigma54-like protein